MTATHQQRHAAKPEPLNVRIAPELIEWLRQYARSQSPPISLNMAAAQAIGSLKATHS